ncbi:MAG: murein biosynthesis integral membrane protein MurJ [Armatimonadetes bacterium]|nr:murein biosynthesis integral membrane protein MurJ [Armatimonadota bacterium]
MSNSLTPNIAKAGLIMTASLLLSRVLGIIREMIIGAMFGQSTMTDAYNYAFSIPDILFYLVAGGALSSAFIPVFSEYLHTGKEEDAWHVFSSVATIMAIFVTAFIALAMVFTPQLARIVAPGLSGPDATQTYELITYMSRIVLPAQFAFFMGGLLFGTLYARQVFSVPGLGPNIYNLGIIFGAVVVSHSLTIPVAGMSWGATVGAFLGNIIVPIWAMRKIGARYRFVIDFKHPGVRKVFRLMGPVVFGLSLPGVFALFLMTFSSYFGGNGIATAFRNANQLMQAPLGVFGQSMALAIFPALSQFVAQQRMDMFRDQLVKTLRTVVYLTVPIALLLLVAPAPIISAIFERRQFSAEDTMRTAPLLAGFAVGVPFWCLQPILMRAFFSLQNTKRPILLGTLTTFIFLGMVAGVLVLKLPAWTLAAAGSVASIILVAMLTRAIGKDVEGLKFGSVGRTAARATVAALPGTALFFGAFWVLDQTTAAHANLAKVAVLFVAGCSSAWLYYFISKAMNMSEAAYFERALKRRRGGKSDETT